MPTDCATNVVPQMNAAKSRHPFPRQRKSKTSKRYNDINKKDRRKTVSLSFLYGGDEGDRTPDLLHAMQALSQLSYAPVQRTVLLY